MKILLIVAVLISAVLLNAYQLSDFSQEEQDEIKSYLVEDIYLETWETIESVEFIKYEITDANEDYWLIVDKDGKEHYFPRK
jgi:hypothetical protein